MVSRRACLKASAFALAGLGTPLPLFSAQESNKPHEIRMWGSPDGAKVGFDPIGLVIAPGETVRWVLDSNVHTTTAYHPKNGGRSLRIPEAAAPWDSGYLINPGDPFEVTLTVEGVYDYFCLPHELAGMVGRIIVGQPIGPGSLPYDYFIHQPQGAKWAPVPAAAAAAFPSIAKIMERKVVPFLRSG
jgi:plastocyanin